MSLPDLTSLPTKHPWISAAIAAALAYVFRTAIEALIKQFFRPFRWLGKKFYWWIAPRNPFSISIRKYKQHISRSNLAFLENPVGPSLRVPLEQSFAPLKLISTDQRREIDLFSYVAQSNRFIVLGGPGTGKTTLMKSLLQSVTQKRCSSQPSLNSYIPVFIVLRNLAAKAHSVEQAIVFALGEHHFPRAEKYVESALADGRLIVILDGLDEVGPNRKFVAQKIVEFCEHDGQRTKQNKAIVTCRENSYRTRDLRSVISEVVRVEPFGNDHMRIFLQGWPSHKGKHALELFSQIQDDPQIKDVCRNPLLLTILTGLFLDTEKFELPTSRDSFYVAALDELMRQRPERRGIEQQFSIPTKYRLLENTALKRLQSARSDEDPEELTKTILDSACRDFFGEKAEPEILLKELTEINGILRVTGDESYTFPHRTLQEFLAARECYRSMEPLGLLNSVGQHTELLEVLHFYCGIIKNIPQLDIILQEFLAKEQYVEAARCLVNMTENPSTPLIAQISEALLTMIEHEDDAEAALIILSSLSGRQPILYDQARFAFRKAIDHLMRTDSKGTSALESALATSTELAMKVIPGLLYSDSSERRKSALALLRDIGTDQALDQLVRLLVHDNTELRSEAAFIVSGIVKTRYRKLINRSILLPERPTDPLVWPLEIYLPSRLAMSLIEPLANCSVLPPNAVITLGISAFRTFHNLQTSAARFSSTEIVSFWRTIERDLRLNMFRSKIRSFLKMSINLAYLCIFIALLLGLRYGDFMIWLALCSFELLPIYALTVTAYQKMHHLYSSERFLTRTPLSQILKEFLTIDFMRFINRIDPADQLNDYFSSRVGSRFKLLEKTSVLAFGIGIGFVTLGLLVGRSAAIYNLQRLHPKLWHTIIILDLVCVMLCLLVLLLFSEYPRNPLINVVADCMPLERDYIAIDIERLRALKITGL